MLLDVSLKDKLRKAQYEREQLEYQLKTEKDEKELYKVIYSFRFCYWLLCNKWLQNLAIRNLEQFSWVVLVQVS